MRRGVSPLPGNEGGEDSASTTRVFGVPLEEVTRAHTVGGHEVPALVKRIVEYIEEHGESVVCCRQSASSETRNGGEKICLGLALKMV